MKYLYCPKCKELRVKPWYPTKDYCPRCMGTLKVIPIPRNWATYAIYVLAATTFTFVYLNSTMDNRNYLYVGVASVVALLVLQFTELTRGHRYAISKLRVTKSDTQVMKTKGWLKDKDK
ncbi:MAG: hypothetical protein IH630_00595 [Thermoplasmata archaeon]|nr:hypothetical protein [Thermoplasmata archaeon]TFG70115.1 MAG: hypothetical protein E4H25_03075 [Methanomassiliicoccus sp.]